MQADFEKPAEKNKIFIFSNCCRKLKIIKLCDVIMDDLSHCLKILTLKKSQSLNI